MLISDYKPSLYFQRSSNIGNAVARLGFSESDRDVRVGMPWNVAVVGFFSEHDQRYARIWSLHSGMLRGDWVSTEMIRMIE